MKLYLRMFVNGIPVGVPRRIEPLTVSARVTAYNERWMGVDIRRESGGIVDGSVVEIQIVVDDEDS